MKKICFALLILVLNVTFGLAQTEFKINYLINEISKTKNSIEIVETEEADELIGFGHNILPTLAYFFTDSTITKVKSECQKRNLTKGEIAIIIADQIQRMPYARLTGVQNCLFEFCENNPNWIEYYFPWIKNDGFENFEKKYKEWLYSEIRLNFSSKD